MSKTRQKTADPVERPNIPWVKTCTECNGMGYVTATPPFSTSPNSTPPSPAR